MGADYIIYLKINDGITMGLVWVPRILGLHVGCYYSVGS